MSRIYVGPSEISVNNCPAYLHVLNWGSLQEILRDERRHISHKLERKIAGLISKQFGYWFRYDIDLLTCFQPAPSVEDITKMAIYESFDKYKAERRTIGKPAKMLRKILPCISETDANEFAVWWSENFTIDSDKYTISESTDEADFVAAYKGSQSKTYDPYLGNDHGTFGTKSLQSSCMRHEFDNLPVHPASAYASGDFKIVWAQDSSGLIAGRALVSIAQKGVTRGKGLAGPIYTTSDKASALIANYLTAQDCLPESNWKGSRLKKIECNGGYVLPYIDGQRSLSESNCGDYLIFDSCGAIEADQTSGLVEAIELTICDCCGERYDSEDEGSFVDSHGYLCDSCLNRNFTYYEYDYYHNDNCVEVYSYSRYGTKSETIPLSYVESSGQYVLTNESEYWNLDDCVFVESLQEFYPSQSDDIFCSEIDNEYYCITEKVKCDNKDMTKKQRDELVAQELLDTELTLEATNNTEMEMI